MKQSQTGYNDGIDLLALILVLWRQKWLILFTTFLCTFVGIVFIWFAKPVYEVKAYVFPPTEGDIAAFNYGKSVKKNPFLKVFSVEDIYGIFTHNLFSQSMKQLFFKEVFLPSFPENHNKKLSYGTMFDKFESALTIKQAKQIPTDYIITVRNHNASIAEEWAQRYIALVNERTVADVRQIIQSQNNNIVNGLKLKIDIAKKVAQKRRQDQLIQLKEDLNIASAIGLNAPFYSQEKDYSLQANKAVPRYLRGAKALQTQINIISSRKSDDPFSTELRYAQEELSFYKNINVNTGSVAVFRLDGKIEALDRPVSPKKSIIIIASMMIGLFLGLSIAFIRNLLLPSNSVRIG